MVIVVLTVLSQINHELVPLHLNVTAFSLSIIIIGSFGSLEVMIQEFKKVYIQGKKSEFIESVSKSEAFQFPVVAGVMLVSLYLLIQYFGKDVVNYVLLVYIALGSSTGIKALLQSITSAFDSLDEAKLVDRKIPIIEFTITITPLDIICCIISIVQVVFYVYSKSWIYNNILAIVFCIHALQYIFINSFSTGFIMLSLLFFYDIFFVFGTDVMITVAKNIDAPIKLQFPKNMEADPPQYSILGLGDIVLPGIFMSLCLRFDFLKNIKVDNFARIAENEKKGKADTNSFVNYLIKEANKSSKVYFITVIIGYLIAIITTVVVMIIFDHGQPALLYLVPGCLGSVGIVALVRREFSLVKEFEENKFLDPEGSKKND
mmetsp:Transcript_20006/g.14718  ORF Transcript_20006/g.14718 Transcript_20006/m.14718 type:complete len:375 (-) Transcript_20006:34-1158(-)